MLKKHRDLLNTVLDAVKTKYRDDVAVMLIYGSCVNGTSHDKSDLDMIFIPKTERGAALAKTFILDGVGYDLWGADWSTLERFARFEDMKVSVLAESELVYYSSEEDRLRYEELKSAAEAIANGPLTDDLINKAEERLNTARQYFGALCLEADLKFAGGILTEVCGAVCLLNRAYLRYGSKRVEEELSALKQLPPGFVSTYKSVAEQPENVKENCGSLIKMTARLLDDLKRQTPNDPPDFTGLYEELSSHWNKIRAACAAGDALTAFLSAASLQDEIDYAQKQFRVSIPDLRFFDTFYANGLDGFVLRADKAETAFADFLRSRGVAFTRYAGLDELGRNL